jgi:hypothetical protein
MVCVYDITTIEGNTTYIMIHIRIPSCLRSLQRYIAYTDLYMITSTYIT